MSGITRQNLYLFSILKTRHCFWNQRDQDQNDFLWKTMLNSLKKRLTWYQKNWSFLSIFLKHTKRMSPLLTNFKKNNHAAKGGFSTSTVSCPFIFSDSPAFHNGTQKYATIITEHQWCHPGVRKGWVTRKQKIRLHLKFSTVYRSVIAVIVVIIYLVGGHPRGSIHFS